MADDRSAPATALPPYQRPPTLPQMSWVLVASCVVVVDEEADAGVEAQQSAAAAVVAHAAPVAAAPAAADVSLAVTLAAVTAAAAAVAAAVLADAAAWLMVHSCKQMHSACSTTQQLRHPNEASWRHQTSRTQNNTFTAQSPNLCQCQNFNQK